jgi:COP9 signalosome complex subunit 6
MEVDTAGTSGGQTNGTLDSSVMATTGAGTAVGAQGSVSVAIHPLVIMNVSEHWTRQRAQEGKPTQVIGALIGKQKGRSIEIFNTFELKFDVLEGNIVVDKDFYTVREEQFKQVFQDLDFLGWYTTGGSPTSTDIAVHKQICDINESPVFLKLNPATKHSDLPISVFESVIDIVEGKATMLFVEIPFTLATEDSERIGVDHVARVSTVAASTGPADAADTVSDHLTAQYSAIKMLHSRVRLIMDYVKAVDDGTLTGNNEILRDIKSLVHKLPLMDNEQFQSDYRVQCNDVTLMTYLGSVTKVDNT